MIRKTVIQYVVLMSLHYLAANSIAAVYATFLTSKGLNLFQVNMMNLVFFTTLFVCEIPTGAFADIFGRKASFVFSCFLYAVSMYMYAASETMFGFAASEIVGAIGLTFSSGAIEAWVVDKLKYHGHDGPLHHVFSKAQISGKLVGIAGAIIGSQLADIHVEIPWIFGGTVSLLTGFLAHFWLREEYFVKKSFSFALGLQSMKNTISQSIEFGIKNKQIRFLLVVGLIQIFAVQAPNMQWQPYFLQYLVEKKLLGYLWMGMMLGLIAGNLLAGKLLKHVKNEKKALTICQVSAGLGMILVTFLPFPVGIAVFILHEIPRGMYLPLKDKYLHDSIPSHARATISSFESTSPHLGGMIGLLISGAVAQSFSIQTAWVMSGSLMIILTLLVARNGSRRKSAAQAQ